MQTDKKEIHKEILTGYLGGKSSETLRERSVKTLTTLFVSALPFKVREVELRAFFEPYGHVESVEIFADWVNASFEPYAHIRMTQADAAVQALDGKIIGSTYLRVNPL